MRWEHDGVDMDTAPRMPDGRDFDWGKIKHRHVLVGDALFYKDGIYQRWRGVSGRHCNRRGCSFRNDDPVCCESVRDSGRWPSFHRCDLVGVVLVDSAPGSGENDSRIPPPRTTLADGSTGWYYCRKHDPSFVAEKQRIANVKYKVDLDRRLAPGELVRAVHEWLVDELAVGEGICDEACEHHACRLARAVRDYDVKVGRAE
jgi:hypothetical protein